MIKFFVPGEPRPKQSYRSTGPGRGYQPAHVKAWQERIGWIGLEAMRGAGLEATTDRLAVRLDFHLGNHRRVDLDNLSKAVLDGLNRVCWEDDQQIAALTLVKHVQDQEIGVDVEITSIEEDGAQ
jgi:Holliday junction resolvase RusA-like endonuclease